MTPLAARQVAHSPLSQSESSAPDAARQVRRDGRVTVGCLFAAVGPALWFLVAGNGGLALAGVSLALLLCPLVMGVVMWLLMRQPQSAPHQSDFEPRDDHVSAGRG